MFAFSAAQGEPSESDDADRLNLPHVGAPRKPRMDRWLVAAYGTAC